MENNNETNDTKLENIEVDVDKKVTETVSQNWFGKNKREIFIFTFTVLLLGLFFYPLFASINRGTSYYLLSFTIIFIFAAMVLTLNLEVGYLGIPNFGKVAFIAVGGYTYSIVEFKLDSKYAEGDSLLFGITYTYAYLVLFAIFMAMLVSGLFGILLTLPTLKLREDYLAIVTIVAGEIVRNVVNNEEELGAFEGFTPDNPVFRKYPDANDFIGGFYLSTSLLVLTISFIFGIQFLNFFMKRRSKMVRGKYFDEFYLQRSISIATIVTIGLIFADYNNAFGDPSIGFHIALIVFVITLVLYKSYLMDRIRSYEYFAFIYFIVGLNYGIGKFLINESTGIQIGTFTFQDVTEMRTWEWFTMLMGLLTLIFVYVILEEIYHSPFGRTLRAIREDDTSAISVGKSVFQYRLKALVIAAVLSGLAGAIYAFIIPIVAPNQYLPLLTFTLYIMLIIGGTGNNKGAIYGAFIIQLLFQITRGTLLQDNDWTYPAWGKIFSNLTSGNLQYASSTREIGFENVALIIVGVTLILFLIYASEGIFPEIKKNNEKYYNLVEVVESEEDDDWLLNLQLKLTGAKLDKEDWISNE